MIGENIKAVREQKRITQYELAQRIGCTQGTLSKYETGELGVDASVLLLIANALNEPINIFYENSA